ncbi:MAG: HAD family phosphatase [Candidatus Micrarchaeota archaeon]
MKKAIIWDLDGVLVDSEPIHIQIEIQTLEKYGLELTEEIAKKYFGLSTRECFTRLAQHYKKSLPIDDMLITHKKLLAKNYVGAPLVDNILEVLEKLSKNYTMAIATSSTEELAMIPIKQHSLQKYFKTAVFATDVKKSKPDPEIFLLACSKLNANPRDTIVVEDSQNGVIAAKSANIDLILARRAEHNKDENLSLADFIFSDVNEIIKIITGN